MLMHNKRISFTYIYLLQLLNLILCSNITVNQHEKSLLFMQSLQNYIMQYNS
jgi:hypothetical protein